MEGLDTGALAIVAACFVAWALPSRLLARYQMSAPMAMVALGVFVAHEPIALLDVGTSNETIKVIAECAWRSCCAPMQAG